MKLFMKGNKKQLRAVLAYLRECNSRFVAACVAADPEKVGSVFNNAVFQVIK